MQILLEPKRTGFDLNWTMFRMPVRVHPLFWLTALILAYTDKQPFGLVLVEIAAIFVSILVHEFGHAFAFRYYGDRRPRVVLYGMGGLAVPGSVEVERWPRIVTLLWGPGAGFILGAIAYGIGAAVFGWRFPLDGAHATGGMRYVLQALHTLVWINFMWGLVNLVPVFPLDGGQIAREWMTWKKRSLGPAAPFSVSFYTAIVAAFIFMGLALYWNSSNEKIDFRHFWPVFLFGILAYQSWVLRRQIQEYGEFGDGGGFENRPREPWEQDADWWKRT